MMPNGLMPTTANEAPPPGPQLGEFQNASPEEQAQYDKFVAKGLEFVFDEKMLPGTVDMLQGDGDPVAGLARTTALIIGRISTAAEKAGEKLSGDVVLHAGTEIFENLADVSKEVGVKNFEEDPDALEGAYFRTLDEFRMLMTDAGRIDQEAAKGDLAQLQAMDERGELGPLMKKLAAEDPRRRAPQGEEQPIPQERKGLMPQ